MIEIIGTNAGLVWNVLNKNGKMTLKEIKKQTKIRTEKEVCLALGWLAKEGKLKFKEETADFTVELV